MLSSEAALQVLTHKIRREGPSWGGELMPWLQGETLLGAGGCPEAGELRVLLGDPRGDRGRVLAASSSWSWPWQRKKGILENHLENK